MAREASSQNKPFLGQDVFNMNAVQGFMGGQRCKVCLSEFSDIEESQKTFPPDIWSSESTCCKVYMGKAC